MLHPLPLPLSSCLGCIPPLIGLPSLRFYAVGSSLFLLSVCFCLCSLFYRDDVLCWLLLARPFLYAFHAHLRFPVDLVWFRLSCDHGWIRSGSVNVRKQQQQQLLNISYHNGHPLNLILMSVKTNMLEKGRRSDSSQFILTIGGKTLSRYLLRASDRIFSKNITGVYENFMFKFLNAWEKSLPDLCAPKVKLSTLKYLFLANSTPRKRNRISAQEGSPLTQLYIVYRVLEKGMRIC